MSTTTSLLAVWKEQKIAELSVIEAVREAMREEMRRDDSVFVMGEDIGARGGVFLATEGFVEEFGEARVIDTPLAESSIAAIALGAAMHGMRPIAEIEFADFIWPTFNQIVGEAARVRYGTNGKLSVPMVMRAPTGRRRAGRPLSLTERRSVFRPHAGTQRSSLPPLHMTRRGCSRARSGTTTPSSFSNISGLTGWCGEKFPMKTTPSQLE